MSVIESLPRVGKLRVPRADGLIQWIVPLIILVIWQVACATGFVSPRVLPAPSDVAKAGWKLLLSGELERNIWVSFWRAGVGLVRGGAGTALVGDPQTVAARIREYQDVGIDTFIMSGYPHLEEAYRFAELVFPLLSLAQSDNVTQLNVNTGPFGETIANEHRPLIKASQS